MEYPRQITAIQAAGILVSTLIGVGVLALPLFATRAADSGGPLVTLLAIILAYVGLWTLTKLGLRFPRQSIIQYSEVILGKWPSRITSSLITLFFALLTSLGAREFGEVVITSVLRRTPLEVTVIIMLALAALSCRKEITDFAYIHHFYLPVIVFPTIFILSLSMKNAQLFYLLPPWGVDTSPSSMIKGVLTIAALLQGFFIYTMVIPAMRRPSRAMLASFWGMFIAGAIYLANVVGAIGVFGPEETELLLWPTLELAKTTTLPGNILERLDAAFLAVWVTAVFTTLFSSYYFIVQGLSKMFRLREHKPFSLFIFPYLFGMAMLPHNVLQLYEIISYVGSFGLLLTIGYPLVLLMVAIIRKKRGESDEAPSH